MAEPPKQYRFKKGQSGNPKGRPKKLPALDTMLVDVLGEVGQNGDAAIIAILKVLRAKAAKGDIRAIELLLDRYYGKVTQNIEQRTEVVVPQIKWADDEPNDEPEPDTQI